MEDLLPTGVSYTITGEYKNAFVNVTVPSGLSPAELDFILRTTYNETEEVIEKDITRITITESA